MDDPGGAILAAIGTGPGWRTPRIVKPEGRFCTVPHGRVVYLPTRCITCVPPRRKRITAPLAGPTMGAGVSTEL